MPGVGEDHLHLPVLEADGHGAVTQGVGTEEEEGGGGVGDDPLGAFQKLQPLLLRQGPVKGLLGEPLPHQDPPEEVPRLLLFHQGLLQGLAGDPPLLQEELPELEVLLALARRRRGDGKAELRVVFGQGVEEGAFGGLVRLHHEPREVLHLLEAQGVQGVEEGHPHHPRLLVQGEGDGLEFLGLLRGKEGLDLGGDLHPVELHQGDAEAVLNGLGDPPLGEEAHVHQDLGQGAPHLPVPFQGPLQLLVREEPGVQEGRPEPFVPYGQHAHLVTPPRGLLKGASSMRMKRV